MSYLGNSPAARFSAMDKQTITGDGTTGPYTLTHAVGNEQEIEVFVNNVRQEPSVAYNVVGTALTMTGNVASTDDFYVVFQGKAQQTATHPSGSALQATTGTFSSNVDVGGSLLVNTVKDGANTNTAMTISSSGLVTLPNSVYITRFSLQSNLTANGDLTDWASPSLSKQVSSIGTVVTVSSGVFTFPVTGIWRIHANLRVLAISDTSVGLSYAVSTDGGSTFTDDYVFGSEGDGSTSTNTGSIVLTDYLNVDNVSNVKMKIVGDSISASSYVQGIASSSGMRTWVSFERITDAQ